MYLNLNTFSPLNFPVYGAKCLKIRDQYMKHDLSFV